MPKNHNMNLMSNRYHIFKKIAIVGVGVIGTSVLIANLPDNSPEMFSTEPTSETSEVAPETVPQEPAHVAEEVIDPAQIPAVEEAPAPVIEEQPVPIIIEEPAPAPESTPPTPVVDTAAIDAYNNRPETCKEVIAANLGPYVKGVDIEYDWYRDGDGDGQVCERE